MKKTIVIFVLAFTSQAFALLDMLPRPRRSVADVPSWERKVACTNSTSDWILFPQVQGVNGLTAQIKVASNTAYLEFTMSSFTDLTNGNVLIFVWPMGTVSTNAYDTWSGPITAVRFKGLTNYAEGTVIAQ